MYISCRHNDMQVLKPIFIYILHDMLISCISVYMYKKTFFYIRIYIVYIHRGIESHEIINMTVGPEDRHSISSIQQSTSTSVPPPSTLHLGKSHQQTRLLSMFEGFARTNAPFLEPAANSPSAGEKTARNVELPIFIF